MTAFTFNTNITNAQRGIPTLTFTTAGTSGTSDLSAAKSFITLTDHRGVTRKYVITDTQNGGVANTTVLAHGSDIGSENIDKDGATANLIGGIAVATNLSSNTQRDILVALKACIESANGHGGDADGFESTVTVSAVPATPTPDAAISMTVTAPAGAYTNAMTVEETVAVAGVVSTNTNSTGNNNYLWEELAGQLDDSTPMSTELQARMATADSTAGGGFDIVTTEYETKFIPTLREFKKKVK